jgi:uncharacterized protein YndB with AHSA1/START domain
MLLSYTHMPRDPARLTVVKEKSIPAGVEEVWRHLTDGALLTAWFADTEGLRPGGEFVFGFGDGDFFSGRVAGWDAPDALRLRWRFMGVGPTYDILYSLCRDGNSTRLTVRDEGALTHAEAEGLAEGWEDFLTRLECRVRTKQPARYEWSEAICVTALLGRHAPAGVETFREQDWWRANFPGARVSFDEAQGDAAKFSLREEGWGGAATNVAVTVRRFDDAACAEINHVGWTGLAPGRRIAERRRYAGLWAEALRRLERDAGAGQANDLQTFRDAGRTEAV